MDSIGAAEKVEMPLLDLALFEYIGGAKLGGGNFQYDWGLQRDALGAFVIVLDTVAVFIMLELARGKIDGGGVIKLKCMYFLWWCICYIII